MTLLEQNSQASTDTADALAANTLDGPANIDSPETDNTGGEADNPSDTEDRATLYQGEDVLSIREFAPLVGKSRPTVSTKIKELTSEPDALPLGLVQGSGKPTLLNRDDQERLADAFGVTLNEHGIPDEVEGELVDSTKPTPSEELQSSLTVLDPNAAPQQGGQGSGAQINVYKPVILNLQVTSSAGAVDQTLSDLRVTLGNYDGNEALINDALIQQAQQRGARTGAQLAAAETSALLSTKEQATLLLLQQQGLLPTEQAKNGSGPSEPDTDQGNQPTTNS